MPRPVVSAMMAMTSDATVMSGSRLSPFLNFHIASCCSTNPSYGAQTQSPTRFTCSGCFQLLPYAEVASQPSFAIRSMAPLS